ncbi:MAG TPA: hypothetical protein VJ464_20265 [Blastocatellia bacterium]|nr:hypothetical protein [Blastocatellia bacterium]
MAIPEPTIITFYSYKGGVGRSMALANVAWLLASQHGLNVLVIDWDLEAPGLHHFFDMDDLDIRHGLLDMLYDYKQILREATGPLPEDVVKVKKYVQPVPTYSGGGGSISILAAGRQDGKYAGRVNDFDWKEFYDKWFGFGFMENFKKQVKGLADIVLIDSRTGVTDIGGICTLQLPDTVVLLFALNAQNVDGVRKIADKILERTPQLVEREPPKLILRPSRVERYLEEDKLKDWQEKAAARLHDLLSETDRQDPIRFMAKKNIPYIGAYAFGETPLSVPNSPLNEMTAAFEDLTQSLVEAAALPEIRPRPAQPGRRFGALRGAFQSRRFLKQAIAALAFASAILLGLTTFSSIYQYLRFTAQRNVLVSANQRLTSDLDQAREEVSQLRQQLEGGPKPPVDARLTALAVDSAKTLAKAEEGAGHVYGKIGNAVLLVYHIDNRFLVIAKYASAEEAAQNLELVKSQFNKDAFAIDLAGTCPNAAQRHGYTECRPQSVGVPPTPSPGNKNVARPPSGNKNVIRR